RMTKALVIRHSSFVIQRRHTMQTRTLTNGIYGIKPRFQKALGGVERWLVARRVHPDYLTFAALALSIVGGVVLYASRWTPWLLLLVPLIALGRTALNALDGLVARGTGLARPWGEV